MNYQLLLRSFGAAARRPVTLLVTLLPVTVAVSDWAVQTGRTEIARQKIMAGLGRVAARGAAQGKSRPTDAANRFSGGARDAAVPAWLIPPPETMTGAAVTRAPLAPSPRVALFLPAPTGSRFPATAFLPARRESRSVFGGSAGAERTGATSHPSLLTANPRMDLWAGPAHPLPATTTTYNGNFIVDSSNNPGGQNSLGAGDAIIVNNGNVIIGDNQTGVFTQTGGTFTVNDGEDCYIGYGTSSTGTFNLSGGTLLGTAANGLSGSLIVGLAGNGTFEQTGGTVNYPSLGIGRSNTGNYNLSGSGVIQTDTIYVGEASSGTLTQTGGMVDDTGTLEFGINGGPGTYNLSGGTLQVGQVESVASGGTSTFNFNGGTLEPVGSTTNFFAGLSVANVQANGAIIDTAGYDITIGQALVHDTTSGAPATDGGLTKDGAGTLTLTGTNTYTGNTTVNAGTLAITAGGVGVSGSTASLTVNATGSTAAALVLSGSATLNTAYDYIGTTSAGTFTQSGTSTHTVDEQLFVGYPNGSSPSGSGTYDLQGGTLDAGATQIGNTGTGTFNQSGGGQTISGSLLIGLNGGIGYYNLSGGTLTTGNDYVGYSSLGNSFDTAEMDQTGGTHTVNGSLFIGYNTGTTGSYSLGGGTSPAQLSAATEYVGYNGIGQFIQVNGTNMISGSLSVGTNAAGNGNYELEGGSLSVAGALTLAGASGSLGAFELDGGTLTTQSDVVGGGGTGTFTQSGGSHTTGTLTLAQNGGTGTYTLSTGGLLQVSSVSGGGGTSDFDFNGGTLQAGANSSAFLQGLSNAYVQAGGAVIDSNGYDVTTAQPLVNGTNGSADGGLTKMGDGTLTLTGASKYTGPTAVNAGTLSIAGSGSLTNTAITVNAGGTLNVTDSAKVSLPNLTLAVDGVGSAAAVTLSGSASLATDTDYIGEVGTGTFTQSGTSTHTVAGVLYLGSPSSGTATTGVGTYNLQGGTLSSNQATIGSYGMGRFDQSGGTFNDNGGLFLGLNGGSGTYTLSSGALTTGSIDVGDGAGSHGEFDQSGGTNALNLNLEIGVGSSVGVYNLSGGTLNDPSYLIDVGFSNGGQGTFTLSASGQVTGDEVVVGDNGTGTFTQTGGTVNVGLVVIGYNHPASGTYNLEGGTLTTPQVSGNNGTSVFNFNGGTLTAGASDNPGTGSGQYDFFSDLSHAYVLGTTNAANTTQSDGAIIDTNGYNVTVAQNLESGIASGSLDGGLTKQGDGTLTLTGTDTYTGATSVSGGTLALPSGSIASTAYVSVDTGAFLTLSGTGNLATAGSAYIGVNGLGTFQQTGGTAAVANTLNLAVNSGSTGTYELDGGTLRVGGGGVQGGSGTSTFNFNGGTVQATASSTSFFSGVTTANVRNGGAIFDTNGNNVTVAQALTHSDLGTLLDFAPVTNSGTGYLAQPTVTITGGGGYGATASAVLNASGQITNVVVTSLGFDYTSTPTITISGGDGSGAAAIALLIPDNPIDGGLTKDGSGTLTLSGDNTYTGPTTVNAGTLQAGVATSAFGSGSAVVLANTSGVTLDLNGYNETVGSLAGGGTSGGNVTLGGGTLTAGADNTSTIYDGVISGGGGLTKIGTGSLTLSGAETYSGATAVEAGTLVVNGSIASTGAVAVSDGATLAGSGSIAGAVTIAYGGTLTIGTTGTPGTLTVGAGGVMLTSGSKISLTLGGATTGSYSELVISNGGTISLGGASLELTLAGGFRPALDDTFVIVSTSSTLPLYLGGIFANGTTVTDNQGDVYQIQYDANQIVLEAVPEPNAWRLVACGACALLAYASAKRRVQ